MPNLTQKTLASAKSFEMLLNEIMSANTDEERQVAYKEFIKHELVEKQLTIASKTATSKDTCKKEICPLCDMATTSLKRHQKTLKCLEISESKFLTNKYNLMDVSKTAEIKYRAVEARIDRQIGLNTDYDSRREQIKKHFGIEKLVVD